MKGYYIVKKDKDIYDLSINESTLTEALDKLKCPKILSKYKEYIHYSLRLKIKGKVATYMSKYSDITIMDNFMKVDSVKNIISENEFPIISNYHQVNTISKIKYLYKESNINIINKNGYCFIQIKGETIDDINKIIVMINTIVHGT